MPLSLGCGSCWVPTLQLVGDPLVVGKASSCVPHPSTCLLPCLCESAPAPWSQQPQQHQQQHRSKQPQPAAQKRAATASQHVQLQLLCCIGKCTCSCKRTCACASVCMYYGRTRACMQVPCPLANAHCPQRSPCQLAVPSACSGCTSYGRIRSAWELSRPLKGIDGRGWKEWRGLKEV